MDDGMDTGPILMSATTPIGADETAGELATRLATLGAGLLVETLARIDTLTPTPQRHEEATLAPRLEKIDGHLDLARPARELADLVRGCNPWPGAVAKAPTGQLTIWRARAVDVPSGAPPGTLVQSGAGPVIATGERALLPVEVQPENRRPMAWDDYLRGARLAPGALVTTP
jgi:methionyl-tRNA formyltransferase